MVHITDMAAARKRTKQQQQHASNEATAAARARRSHSSTSTTTTTTIANDNMNDHNSNNSSSSIDLDLSITLNAGIGLSLVTAPPLMQEIIYSRLSGTFFRMTRQADAYQLAVDVIEVQVEDNSLIIHSIIYRIFTNNYPWGVINSE